MQILNAILRDGPVPAGQGLRKAREAGLTIPEIYDTLPLLGVALKPKEHVGPWIWARSAESASSDSQEQPKTRRRRRTEKKEQPLTEREAEAVHQVGDHKGNLAAAARVMGVSYQRVQYLYRRAMKKLGRRAAKTKTVPLPVDRRGQTVVSTPMSSADE
jgi:DNA-binding CsgD family transcriptional regulator